MNTPWRRLWREMPNDPKWRAVARKSGRSIPEIISVFVVMLTTADDDGTLDGWNDDVVAAGLDMDGEAVAAIRAGMQGLVLDGGRLAGWQKRQPKRDDDSRDRVRKHREMKRTVTQRNADVTHGNAPDTDTEEETERTLLPPEQETAREEVKAKVFDLSGVVCGSACAEISPQARLRVARILNVADPTPVVEAYRRWKGSKRAQKPDAHFIASAPKIFERLCNAEKSACQPLNERPPEIVVKPVAASPQLVARLARSSRHAH